ncbi:MFS transporter [bacterium]|nr:MFS transporter [bacterium]
MKLKGLKDRFDWWLAGICLARTFNGTVFVTYAASLPVLQSAWMMSGSSAGTIAGGFSFGYAISLAVVSNLADRVGPKPLYLMSMTTSAVFAMLFAVFARDYWSGLVLYTLLALSMGGNYTTALMIISERYPFQRRGRAMGFFIASTSLGYTLSLVLSGTALPIGGYRLAFYLTCAGPVIGAILAWIILSRTQVRLPNQRTGKKLSREVFGKPSVMTLIYGYTGHSWELLGMWAWTPAFLSACLILGGGEVMAAAGTGAYVTAAFHVTGLVASFTMGSLSDRIGRSRVMVVLTGLSTIISFTFGWTIFWPYVLVFILGLVYSFACLGDSPILSAALTETVDSAYMGTAFGLRSLLGFGAGAASSIVFGFVLDLSNPAVSHSAVYETWGWAFGILGLGGLLAVVSAYMYGRYTLREATQGN